MVENILPKKIMNYRPIEKRHLSRPTKGWFDYGNRSKLHNLILDGRRKINATTCSTRKYTYIPVQYIRNNKKDKKINMLVLINGHPSIIFNNLISSKKLIRKNDILQRIDKSYQSDFRYEIY